MKLIHCDEHHQHAGAKEMRYDKMIPMSDTPERIDLILHALQKAGFNDLIKAQHYDLTAVYKIHDTAFVSFLESAYDLWKAEFGPDSFATAYTFGMRGMAQHPNASVHSMLAYYTFDVCVPFVEGTYKAIRSAVNVALTGVDLILAGERSVFSLCRPPGHHASQDLAGGYCYLNNVAIAAQAYLDAGKSKVAILDVDYHHGNGTQRVFYERDDVFFVSLHASPIAEYPFLMGYPQETGAGAGEGFNLNLAMDKGTEFAEYVVQLEFALAQIAKYQPDILLISLGVDTYIDDPVGGFKLLTEDYLKMGALIAQCNLPTHFVMEGGYAFAALGSNVTNVISGFSHSKSCA
ncbi:MAG: acetoin utilization deacetylase AcuC-like enzyme [Oceanospirillaceae bacterium]|jgi:acetoin utilization deacetylase AcuC-like enzyme